MPLVVFVSCAPLFPIGLGAARQQVPSWWAPGQSDVVVLQQPSVRHCLAMEGGEVASWYARQVFG
ncbi:MAG: hypothetical protein JNM69_30895 [Archangium sp.]|nr:hypothetical protein [Archangium sp.]